MTEGQHERVEAAVTPVEVVATPLQRTPEEFAQDKAARDAAIEAKFGEAMTAEEGYKLIGEALITKATDGAEGAEYLGEYLEHDAFPDEINQCLWDYQCKKQTRKPDYDVTKEPPKRLARILERGIGKAERAATTLEAVKQAEQVEAEAKRQETEAEATLAATAQDRIETAEKEEASLETYKLAVEKLGDLPNNKKISALLSDEYIDAVPEAERAKLAKFAAMMQVAAAVPADQEIIAARINQMDMNTNVPDPVGFVRAFIFDNPSSQLPSGISEATQNAIAAQLGIERPDLDVTTGSEMSDVFEKGVGTKEVRDPDTGEIREEPIFLAPGEFAEIRDGQSIGLTDAGERAMKFSEAVGDFTVILPDNATSEDMVMYGLAGQMMSQLHDVNMAEVMFPNRDFTERGGGVLDIRMPDDFNRTQRLCQIFYGNFAGYDGALLSQSDLDRIPYLMQFQNSKADAVIGDINPEQMKADYRRQGLLDDSGSLIWDKFAQMVEANRLGLWTSEQNFSRTAA